MQFRCYNCGYTFSKGLPPAEALDQGQSSVAGIHDAQERFDIMDGTPFEGMSTYQFCTFCLIAIKDFPSAFAKKGDYYDQVANLPEEFSWVYRNRLMVFLAAKEMYPHADFRMLGAWLDEKKG